MVSKRSDIYFDIEIHKLLKKTEVVFFDSEEVKQGPKLGSGGFGKIITGIYQGLRMAMKKLKEYNPKELFREITILRKFSHPSIPRFYGLVKSKEIDMKRKFSTESEAVRKIEENLLGSEALINGVFYQKLTTADFIMPTNPLVDIAEELVVGKTLRDFMKTSKLNEIEKLIILQNLANTLDYLHDNRVIHRDLKPENIMINNKFELKLFDFGISKIASDNRGITRTKQVGTMCYMAPENFMNNSEEEEQSEEQRLIEVSDKVDVWAFGCIVQEFISGVKPWSNKVKSDIKIMACLYKKQEFDITNLIEKGSQIRILIEKCTVVDPTKRISIKEAKGMLMNIIITTIKKELSFEKDIPFSEKVLKIFQNIQNLTNQQKFHFLKQIEHFLFQFTKKITFIKKPTSPVKKSHFIEKLKTKSSLNFIGMKILKIFSENTSIQDDLDKEIKIFLEKEQIIQNKKLELELNEKNLMREAYNNDILSGKIKFTQGVSIIKKKSRFDQNPDFVYEKNKKKVLFHNIPNFYQEVEMSNSNKSNQTFIPNFKNLTIDSTVQSFSVDCVKKQSPIIQSNSFFIESNKKREELQIIKNVEIKISKIKKKILKQKSDITFTINSKNKNIKRFESPIFPNNHKNFSILGQVPERKLSQFYKKFANQSKLLPKLKKNIIFNSSHDVNSNYSKTEEEINEKGIIYLNFPKVPELIRIKKTFAKPQINLVKKFNNISNSQDFNFEYKFENEKYSRNRLVLGSIYKSNMSINENSNDKSTRKLHRADQSLK